jgi:hypothetical protein
LWHMSKEARTPPQQVFCHVSCSEEVPFGMKVTEIFYICKSTIFPVENSFLLLLFFMYRAVCHWRRCVESSCYCAFFICSDFIVYSSVGFHFTVLISVFIYH